MLSERRLLENVEQHGDTESRTGGARCDNRKEASCGQGYMVVER